jgi:DNA-binding transcriptional ArsR family regulator
VFETRPPRTRVLARALHHPARAALREHIHATAEPVSLIDLARVFDLAEGLVRYHARVLVVCGLIELDREDRACSR